MAYASRQALIHSRYALLIGTDYPQLSIEDLTEVFAALESGFDAVLGPAEDGDYVLIGLRRPVPDLFFGIDWGSEHELCCKCVYLQAARRCVMPS
jgi:uncharacterized protein